MKAPGRGRGPRRGLHRRRLRLARAGLLDVPGHEPRQARRRRAVRLDVEPQLRGPPGPRRAHPPRLPRRRRRHRHRRPLRHPRRPATEPSMEAVRIVRARRCRSTAPTSTPTRSSPATGSSGSSAPASRRACSRSGATTRRSCSTTSGTPAPRSSWPAPTSAPARRVSTPCGRSSTTASRPSSPRGSATSSATTAPRTAWSRSIVAAEVGDRLLARDRGRPDARAHRRRRAPHARGAGARHRPATFPLDDFVRHRFLEGLDDIGITLSHEADITAFEATRPAWLPVADRRSGQRGQRRGVEPRRRTVGLSSWPDCASARATKSAVAAASPERSATHRCRTAKKARRRSSGAGRAGRCAPRSYTETENSSAAPGSPGGRSPAPPARSVVGVLDRCRRPCGARGARPRATGRRWRSPR